MADDKPIIDFGTAPRDLQLVIDKLKLADGVIVKISENALKAGRNLSAIQLPSDLANFTAENQRLTAQIQAQAQALSQLQTQYNNLSQNRRTASGVITQERVDAQILNAERRRELTLSSQVAGAYRKLSAEVAVASSKYQDLIVRGRQARQSQADYNRQLAEAQRDFRTLQNRVLAADNAVDKWNRTNKRSIGLMGDLLGAFGLAGGIAMFAGLSKGSYDLIKNMQSLDLALKSVTGTSENFYAQQVFLNSIAEKHGLEINNLTKQYTSFYVAAKDKLGNAKIQQTFEDIARSGSALGLSNEALERSFMAVNQMLSKGTVASEELRGQLAESMPGAVQAMTKAVQKLHPEIKNLTEKGLFEMIKAGKILASDVLPETAKQLTLITGADSASKIDTITKSTNRLKDAWTDFIRFLSENDTVVSSFFSGATKGATLFLGGLKEILATQGQVNMIKEGSQFQEAYNEFNSSFESQHGSDTVKQQIDFLNKEKKELESFVKDTQKDVDKLTKKIQDAPWYSPELELKDEAAELSKMIGKSKGELKAIEDRLLEIANPKKPTGTNSGTESKKAIEDRLKSLYDANKKELELQLVKADIILNNDDNYYTDRLTALDKDNKIRLQIAKLDYDEHFRLAKDDKNKQRSAEIDYQIAVLNIAEKYGKERISLEKLQLKAIEAVKPKADDSLKESAENAIKQLEQQQEAVKQLAELYKDLQKNTQDWLGSFSSEFLQNSGFGSLETFMDGTFAKLMAGADTTAERFAVAFNAIAETAQETFNFISEASNKNFDNEKQRLQDQYNVSLKYAGDNKAAQEKLAEDLEKSKKDIDYREAKAKQKQAIFNIAIDTAQAVMSAISESPLTLGLPWSAIIAGMGLAQAAMVAGQEIPRYFMGGTHDGGLMMVNDGAGSNYKETIVTPDGKIMKPQGRNVVMNAPIGTEIFTHDQWNEQMNNMLKGNGINWSVPVQQQNGISKSDMKEAMLEAIGEQPQYHTNFDENGVMKFYEKRGNITRITTNRSNGRGIKF